MSIKDKIENNPLIWVLGLLLTGFLAGVGTYEAILRIAQLEVIPSSGDPHLLNQQLSALDDKMNECETKVNEQAQEIARLRRVAAGSRDLDNPRTAYTIYVSKLPRASELVTQLKDSGFNASIYGPQLERQPEAWQGIWIGDDVPVQLAIEAIEVSRRFLPMLRYVSLYGDNPGGLYLWSEAEGRAQMFIGATNRGAAALKPLSEENFRSLLDKSQSRESFYAKVRSFYRP